MKPISQGICCECDKIWREYAHATAEHIKLQMERHMSVARQDAKREKELEPLVAKAEERRIQARAVIRDHEIATHGRGLEE